MKQPQNMEETKMCGREVQASNHSTIESTPNIARKFQAELAARTCALGEEHPAVAETLNALGLIYHHMVDDQEQALEYHARALQIFQLQRGDSYSCTDVALTFSDIANVHRKKGDYERAAKAFMDSVSTFREGGIGDNHPRLQSALVCLQQLGSGTIQQESAPRQSDKVETS